MYSSKHVLWQRKFSCSPPPSSVVKSRSSNSNSKVFLSTIPSPLSVRDGTFFKIVIYGLIVILYVWMRRIFFDFISEEGEWEEILLTLIFFRNTQWCFVKRWRVFRLVFNYSIFFEKKNWSNENVLKILYNFHDLSLHPESFHPIYIFGVNINLFSNVLSKC